MKIDSDLRAAIRSAEKTQPSNNYEQRTKAKREAIEQLLNQPRHRAKVLRLNCLVERRKNAQELSGQLFQKIRNIYLELGLNYDGKDIDDHKVFVAVGGVSPDPKLSRWTFDQVMAELGAADPKDMNKILGRYGIRWE